MSTKLVFLHDYDESVKLDSDAFVIALYPDVCFKLDQKKIPYTKLEDHYIESDLSNNQDKYFEDQLHWLSELNSVLKLNISELENLKIDIPKLCLINLKYLIDELVIESRIINKVLQKFQPDFVVFIRKHHKNMNLRESRSFLNEEKNNFIVQILQILEEDKKFILQIHDLSEALAESNSKPVDFFVLLKTTIKTSARRLFSIIKLVRNFFYYKKYHLRKLASNQRRFLFLNPGSLAVDSIILELISKNNIIFTYSEGSIQCLNHPLEPRISTVINSTNQHSYTHLRNECKQSALVFFKNEYFSQFINREAGCDAFPILAPFFDYFLNNYLVQMLCAAREIKYFFEANKIDALFTTNSSDLISKAALIAARSNGDARHVKAFCIQHGIEAYSNAIWYVTDINPFDGYLAAESLSAARFSKARSFSYVSSDCQIYEFPHYLSTIKKKYSRKTARYKRSRKNTVLYIPTKLVSYMRHFNNLTYSVCWYYDFQKKLIDYFSTLSDSHFLFKEAISARSQSYQSIVAYIAEKKYKNIEIVQSRAYEYFDRCDAIVLDRPTTALFESAMSERPYLCIYPDFVRGPIPKEVSSFFGQSLQSFSGSEEAIEMVRNFLEDPLKTNYQRVFHLPDFCLEDILNNSLINPTKDSK